MKSVGVLGSSGMLGRYVSKYFSSLGYEVNEYNRANFYIEDEEELQKVADNNSVIINCIGVIKQRKDVSVVDFVNVNSVFPHKMSKKCEEFGAKFIHITTDCVFDGKRGRYTEKDPHNPEDIYGKTKSLGEPENCMAIRTSIIGEEKENKRSLVEWVKSQKDGKCNGYINHHWNGVTCLELAKFIEDCVSLNYYWNGVRHIFSPNSVTKFDLVNIINVLYELNIRVDPVESPSYCDRTLDTIYKNGLCVSKELIKQIEEMMEFYI